MKTGGGPRKHNRLEYSLTHLFLLHGLLLRRVDNLEGLKDLAEGPVHGVEGVQVELLLDVLHLREIGLD